MASNVFTQPGLPALKGHEALIDAARASSQHTVTLAALLSSACSHLHLTDLAENCAQVEGDLKRTSERLSSLHEAVSRDLADLLTAARRQPAIACDAPEQADSLAHAAQQRGSAASAAAKASDACTMKKMSARLQDFEAQVMAQLQSMADDMEKKMGLLGSMQACQQSGAGTGGASRADGMASNEALLRDIATLKYELGEVKDMLRGARVDTSHVKRIALAGERDMEDFTAAMDGVNVDLDEMRARVDATHSIVTSRQRVEATVTAEVSTMRLDMGDMQEALKAHDVWMEDVSQSLQEAHERCHQLAEDLASTQEQMQAKLDAKVDVVAWNDLNDDIDASIKTVRDMASALRLEVDSRRRKVDTILSEIRAEVTQLDGKVDSRTDQLQRNVDDNYQIAQEGIQEQANHCRSLEQTTSRHAQIHGEIHNKIDDTASNIDTRVHKLEADLRHQDEQMHKEINDRVDGVERHHANTSKETSKRLNALDLRVSGLQGASGEQKRDINKLRDEVNGLTVKSAAHDVDIANASNDIRRLERSAAETSQRHKQDMDAVYEELDQKVYEANFSRLEHCTSKLARGTVKLCQVVGVFPGAQMHDGTGEELDIDVDLLNWEDCAEHLAGRVEKTWRQASSQRYKSILHLLTHKADHSVLRLTQISQQHIETQLDRARHERDMWRETMDRRAQQPLQLQLTLRDPPQAMGASGPPLQHGFAGHAESPAHPAPVLGPAPPVAPPPPPGSYRAHGTHAQQASAAAASSPPPPLVFDGAGAGGSAGVSAMRPTGAMKTSPLAKRAARPAQQTTTKR